MQRIGTKHSIVIVNCLEALKTLLPVSRSCGGVVLSSTDGRIVVRNTLEDRLRITYNAKLPVIRAQLFEAHEA